MKWTHTYRFSHTANDAISPSRQVARWDTNKFILYHFLYKFKKKQKKTPLKRDKNNRRYLMCTLSVSETHSVKSGQLDYTL